MKRELSRNDISRIEKLKGDHGCCGKARGYGREGEKKEDLSFLRDRKSEFERTTIFEARGSVPSKVD
jgi:hypothetical protein